MEQLLQLTKLSPSNEVTAREVILEGFKERFGFIDPALNPDLKEMYKTYSQNGWHFLVGLLDEQVVCTGALIREDNTTCRIARMSVKKDYRRQGLAETMLKTLERLAMESGTSILVLETNQEWESAVQFYIKMGFTEEKVEEGSKHFTKYIKGY